MSEKIREAVRKAIRETSSHGADVQFQDDTQILAEGIIDSLGVFGVMSELERELGLTLPPDEITAENFSSVDAMLAMVERLVESGAVQMSAAQ